MTGGNASTPVSFGTPGLSTIRASCFTFVEAKFIAIFCRDNAMACCVKGGFHIGGRLRVYVAATSSRYFTPVAEDYGKAAHARSAIFSKLPRRKSNSCSTRRRRHHSLYPCRLPIRKKSLRKQTSPDSLEAPAAALRQHRSRDPHRFRYLLTGESGLALCPPRPALCRGRQHAS